MGASAYYLTEESPQTWTTLVRAPRPESEPYPITDEGIHLETGRGVPFDYGLSSRDTPIYVYRVSTTELATFRAFHQAVVVDGERLPFWFLKDVDHPENVLHCRKQLSFKPAFVALASPAGSVEQMWDITIELEEEIEAADVEE